jgi:hypothetical protein
MAYLPIILVSGLQTARKLNAMLSTLILLHAVLGQLHKLINLLYWLDYTAINA